MELALSHHADAGCLIATQVVSGRTMLQAGGLFRCGCNVTNAPGCCVRGERWRTGMCSATTGTSQLRCTA